MPVTPTAPSQRITTPAAHRAVLFECITGLIERKMSVAAANAVANLSAEVHRSLDSEFEIRKYIDERYEVDFEKARVSVLLTGAEVADE